MSRLDRKETATMTEQHLLDNGYRKYSGAKRFEEAIYQKAIFDEHGEYRYHINVSHNIWPDGWHHWVPCVQFNVLVNGEVQCVNVEAVQWYNTNPAVDTSSHNIRGAEEFFERAIEALGVQEEECMR